jgi:hypothetical protein
MTKMCGRNFRVRASSLEFLRLRHSKFVIPLGHRPVRRPESAHQSSSVPTGCCLALGRLDRLVYFGGNFRAPLLERCGIEPFVFQNQLLGEGTQSWAQRSVFISGGT